MKTTFASIARGAAVATLLACPAAALDVAFDNAPQLSLGGDIHGVDLTGAHEGDRPLIEGDSRTGDSGFMGEPVFLADGESRLGTVDTVFTTDDDRTRIAILIGDGVDLAMADMLYVVLPEGAEPDGSITLDLSEADLVAMSQDWSD